MENRVKVEWRCSCLQSMIKASIWRHAPLSQCHCDMCHRVHSLIRSEPTSWTRQIEHSAAGAKKSVLVFITRNYFTLICITLLLLQIFRCIAQMRNTGGESAGSSDVLKNFSDSFWGNLNICNLWLTWLCLCSKLSNDCRSISYSSELFSQLKSFLVGKMEIWKL